MANKLYANLPRMSDAKFAALIVDLIEAAHDNFEDMAPATRVALETVGHQVAVFLAQRYNASVGTAEAMELLDVQHPMDPKRRLKLARNAMAAFADDRRHAEEGGR